MEKYTEYLIEYDIDLGTFWVSGLTPEKYWIELDMIQVWDDPTEKANLYGQTLVDEGHVVSILDVTNLMDEYEGED